MKFRLLTACLLIFAVTAIPAFATDDDALIVEVVVDPSHGWPVRLHISGDCPQNTAWVGISMYPYAFIDPILDGDHSVEEVSEGPFEINISLDNRFLGGSFEVALWGTKVDKVDCTIDDCYWCEVNGFHLDDLLVYKSGLLTRLTGYGE